MRHPRKRGSGAFVAFSTICAAWLVKAQEPSLAVGLRESSTPVVVRGETIQLIETMILARVETRAFYIEHMADYTMYAPPALRIT